MDTENRGSSSRSYSSSPKRQENYQGRNNKKSNSNSISRSRSRSPRKERDSKNQDSYKNKGYSSKPRGSGKFQKSQSPVRGKPKGQYSTNKPKYLLPQLDGPLVSFRQFMEHQPDKVDKEKAQKFYSQYREEWEAKQNQIFFIEHKEESWFMEKYDPVLLQAYIGEKNEEAVRNSQEFFESLKQGKFNSLKLEYTEEELDKIKAEDQKDCQYYNEENPIYKQYYLNDDIDLTDSPFFGFDQDKNTLFIRNIPKNLSRWVLKKHLASLPGFLAISISDPQKLTDYQRFGWVYFKDEESTNAALQKVQQLMIEDTQFTVIKSQTGKKPVKLAQAIDIEKAKQLTYDLIKVFDREKGININPILAKEQLQEQHTKEDEAYLNINIPEDKILDVQLLYLRKVHSYCYLCGVLYNDERMLASKCSVQHIRIGTQENQEIDMDYPTWQVKIVQIAMDKIDEVNQKIGVTQEEMEEIKKDTCATTIIQKKIKEKIEEKSKGNSIFPCLFCDKKFKACHFVTKHLENKHEEDLQKEHMRVREEIALENYSNDKFKLKPQYNNNNQSNGNKNPQQNRNMGNKRGMQGNKYQKYQYRDYDAPPQGEQEAVDQINLVNYNDI